MVSNISVVVWVSESPSRFLWALCFEKESEEGWNGRNCIQASLAAGTIQCLHAHKMGGPGTNCRLKNLQLLENVMNKHQQYTPGNFGPGNANFSYSSAVFRRCGAKVRGPMVQLWVNTTSGNLHPVLTREIAQVVKRNWSPSITPYSGNGHSTSSEWLLFALASCFPTLFQVFQVPQKALSSILCSLTDYFHALCISMLHSNHEQVKCWCL